MLSTKIQNEVNEETGEETEIMKEETDYVEVTGEDFNKISGLVKDIKERKNEPVTQKNSDDNVKDITNEAIIINDNYEIIL